MNITRFSIKRPIGICMIYILVCVLGLISFFRIGVELLPDVDSKFYQRHCQLSGRQYGICRTAGDEAD